MNTLDLGRCSADAGDCMFCKLGDRPLWFDGEVAACATCIARRYPNREITFHAGRGPITARQDTLPGLVA